MPELAQGPGRAAQSAGTAAENAQLDARLELAAKKAALRSLEAQTGGPPAVGIPAAPAVPGELRGTVTIEQDGKTTVLENPTAEQLRWVGIALPSSSPGVNGWQAVGLTGAVMWGIVAIVWMVLSHRRRVLGVGNTPKGAPDMDGRMARIENAIESVAVEVERISEGQRFTSRILSEGAAVPVGMPLRGEAVPRHNGES